MKTALPIEIAFHSVQLPLFTWFFVVIPLGWYCQPYCTATVLSVIWTNQTGKVPWMTAMKPWPGVLKVSYSIYFYKALTMCPWCPFSCSELVIIILITKRRGTQWPNVSKVQFFFIPKFSGNLFYFFNNGCGHTWAFFTIMKSSLLQPIIAISW